MKTHNTRTESERHNRHGNKTFNLKSWIKICERRHLILLLLHRRQTGKRFKHGPQWNVYIVNKMFNGNKFLRKICIAIIWYGKKYTCNLNLLVLPLNLHARRPQISGPSTHRYDDTSVPTRPSIKPEKIGRRRHLLSNCPNYLTEVKLDRNANFQTYIT